MSRLRLTAEKAIFMSFRTSPLECTNALRKTGEVTIANPELAVGKMPRMSQDINVRYSPTPYIPISPYKISRFR